MPQRAVASGGFNESAFTRAESDRGCVSSSRVKTRRPLATRRERDLRAEQSRRRARLRGLLPCENPRVVSLERENPWREAERTYALWQKRKLHRTGSKDRRACRPCSNAIGLWVNRGRSGGKTR